jgi:hypothetical protein
MRISTPCDANPNAVSGVALAATPVANIPATQDANLIAKSSVTSFAASVAN